MMTRSAKLDNVQQVHFFGIGGSAVSGVARLLHARGVTVSGSNHEENIVTKALLGEGVPVSISQSLADIPEDTDLVVYSVALDDLDPGFMAELRATDLPLMSYPEIRAELSAAHHTIGIAGAHGKTSTTAMLAKVMIDADLDPTVLLGSVMADTGSNVRAGQGEYFVVEAGEYKRGFLSLRPQIIAITNIDLDHLDYFEDLDDIQAAFIDFVRLLPADGLLVCDQSHPYVAPIAAASPAPVIDYTTADTTDLNLLQPGAYNVANAQVALAIAKHLGVDQEVAINALNSYHGVARRFEHRGTTPSGIAVYDDYAHHPIEIKAFLAGVREHFPDSHLIAVFQPHLYSRTKLLFDDFATAFTNADEVIILPIYAAREEPDPAVSAEKLATAIADNGQQARFISDLDTATNELRALDNKDTIILTIGAGDTNLVATDLVRP